MCRRHRVESVPMQEVGDLRKKRGFCGRRLLDRSREPRDKRILGNLQVPICASLLAPTECAKVIVGDDVAVHQVCVEAPDSKRRRSLMRYLFLQCFDGGANGRLHLVLINTRLYPLELCLAVRIVERRCALNNERFRRHPVHVGARRNAMHRRPCAHVLQGLADVARINAKRPCRAALAACFLDRVEHFALTSSCKLPDGVEVVHQVFRAPCDTHVFVLLRSFVRIRRVGQGRIAARTTR